MSDLVEKVRSSGVVGAGGAGFPTHIKYQSRVDLVIANGAECEPLLYVDQASMARDSSLIIEGLRLAMEAVGASRGIIALKAKYREAIDALGLVLKRENNVALHLLESFYPAGDEQVVVFEVTGKVVPEGGIPLQVGVVVNNVGTLINVAKAQEGIPVTERSLTVHGEVRNPSSFFVPVGTSVAEVIRLAGGPTVADYRIILGGPMMGAVIENPDVPVAKTTSGVIVLPDEHPLVQRKTQEMRGIVNRAKAACDQCMACTDSCPRYLLGHDMKPHLIMRAIPHGLADSRIVTSAYLCCECGLCSYYACPLYLSPGLINSLLKREMISKELKNPHRRAEVAPYPFRGERKVPTCRLIERTGLKPYDFHAPWKDVSFSPSQVRIPLQQHLGAPAVPTVKVGMRVRKGDVIGEIPEGKLGARVHASIEGVVMGVGDEVLIVA